jgi:hypothetical protein
MEKELEAYYNTYFDLFLTEGWKQFIEDIISNANNFNIQSIKDAEELYKAQGSLNVLTSIANFEASIKAAYEEITNEDLPLEEGI